MTNDFELVPTGATINHDRFFKAYSMLGGNCQHNHRDALFVDLDETVVSVLDVMRENYGRDFAGSIGGLRYDDEPGLTEEEKARIPREFSRGGFYKNQPLIDSEILSILHSLSHSHNLGYLSARFNTTDIYELTRRNIRNHKLPMAPIMLNPYVGAKGPKFKIDTIMRFKNEFGAPGFVPILIDDEPSQATAIITHNTQHPDDMVYQICMVGSELRSIQFAKSHRDATSGSTSGVYGHALHQEANGVYFSNTSDLIATIDRVRQDSRTHAPHHHARRSDR
jgi:hypothetical protein